MGRPWSSTGGLGPSVVLDTFQVLNRVSDKLKHLPSTSNTPSAYGHKVQTVLAVSDKLPENPGFSPKFDLAGLPDLKSPMSKDIEAISLCQQHEGENASDSDDPGGDLNPENLADLEARYAEFVRSHKCGEWLEPALHTTPIFPAETPISARSGGSRKSGSSHTSTILEAVGMLIIS